MKKRSINHTEASSSAALTWRDFVLVTKPGIILSNVLVAAGAYVFAAGSKAEFMTAVALCAGTAFVVAGACVANNYIDRHIDKHMKRTARRATATGAMGLAVALSYASILLLLGLLVLYLGTNMGTTLVGLFGAAWYVGIYTYAKHNTWLATLLGTLPGGTPPLAGYLAATNSFDSIALLLVLMLVFWQLPHFYAISLFRLDSYRMAGVPTLPTVRGISETVWHMRIAGGLFVVSVALFVTKADLQVVIATILVAVSTLWWLSMWQSYEENTVDWARKVFFRSLLFLPLLAACIGLNGVFFS